jgi:hypothetical protein
VALPTFTAIITSSSSVVQKPCITFPCMFYRQACGIKGLGIVVCFTHKKTIMVNMA